MYISHKSNVLQTVHETEWQCRRKVKGLDKSEYWAWLDSVTSGDPPVADLSGETGYVIVECTDEDVQARLNQLGDYQADGVYRISAGTQITNSMSATHNWRIRINGTVVRQARLVDGEDDIWVFVTHIAHLKRGDYVDKEGQESTDAGWTFQIERI